jgi:hypothetical protein
VLQWTVYQAEVLVDAHLQLLEVADVVAALAGDVDVRRKGIEESSV